MLSLQAIRTSDGKKILPWTTVGWKRRLDPAGPFDIGTWLECWFLFRMRIGIPTGLKDTRTGSAYFGRNLDMHFGLCHTATAGKGFPQSGLPVQHAAFMALSQNSSTTIGNGTVGALDTTFPGNPSGIVTHFALSGPKVVNDVWTAGGTQQNWWKVMDASFPWHYYVFRWQRTALTNPIVITSITPPFVYAQAVLEPSLSECEVNEWFRDSADWATLVASRPTNYDHNTGAMGGPTCNEAGDGLLDSLFLTGANDGLQPYVDRILIKTLT